MMDKPGEHRPFQPPPMNKALSEPNYNSKKNNNTCAIYRSRSRSLQNGSSVHHADVIGGPSLPDRPIVPELINLSNMSAMHHSPLASKNSISFSAVGFMVESMHRLHSQVYDRKQEVEDAVDNEDVRALRLYCIHDSAATLVAALAAIRRDKANILETVLEVSNGVDAKCLVDRREGHGLLHAAVLSEAVNCIQVLLKLGFDPNQWNQNQTASPMHYAASTGQVDIVQAMADPTLGGDINLGEELDGRSVMHAAVRANQLEVLKFLLENKAHKMGKAKFSETALHTSCELNHHECARMLLEDGILVDALRGEHERETGLHIAAANGYCETVELLLKHSADANARNSRGETPLHLAAKMLSGSVMRLLIDHGADVDCQDQDGRPPLHCAINSKLKGGAECMTILIEKGADVNLGDNNGTTALHLAALNRKLTRVKLLIDNGADLCAKNNAGKSALHFVLKYVPNSLKIIEDRLDCGLQVDNPESEHDSIVKMNFNLMVPSNKNHSQYMGDVGLFTEILQMHSNDINKLEKILMHPLSLSFLHLKWQQVKWLYYLIILCSHLIYSITYSIYVVIIFSRVCRPVDQEVNSFTWTNRLSFAAECNLDRSDHKYDRGLAITAWIFLILFNILYTCKEMTKLAHLRSRYFKEWESVLNLTTIITFPLISFHSSPFSNEGVAFSGWQFHAAGIGVLLTWVLQMFLIGKVPRFGKYVQMLINVGWSFFNFFVAYSSLIIGFSLAFVVLFPREVSFQEAITAPIKVMVMMTGEIEYNDLYYPTKHVIDLGNGSRSGLVEVDEITEPQFFPLAAHAVLTIFILTVSIVIMNLLFGMAVSDVQELYKKSRLHQSIQQVLLISYMESMLFSPLFMKLPHCVQDFLRRKLSGLEGRYRNMCELDTHNDKKLLPNYLNKTIKDKCSEIHRKHEDQVSMKSLQTNISRLERQIAALSTALQSQANLNVMVCSTTTTTTGNHSMTSSQAVLTRDGSVDDDSLVSDVLETRNV